MLKSVPAILALACLPLLAGCADPARDHEQPAGTGLQGSVADEAGKPLERAFVWLEADPRICDFTKKDGRFQLEVVDQPASSIVLASAAGKDEAHMSLGDLRKAAGRIVLKQEDPEFTKIEVGAALAFTKNASASTFIKPRPLSDAELTCGMAYLDFLKVEGNALVAKMLVKGGPDPAIGGKYHYIIVGEIAARAQWYEQARNACKVPASRPEKERLFWNGLWQGSKEEMARCQKWVKKAEDESVAAAAKGYAGLHLTGEDLRRARYWGIVRPETTPFMPPNKLNQLGVPAVEWRGLLLKGDVIPPFRFRTLDSVLNTPEYSDAANLVLTEYLRPEGLAQFLHLRLPFYAAEAMPDGGHSFAIRLPPATNRTTDAPGVFVAIRQRCAEKPVVLGAWHPGDRFFWLSMDLLEYLQRAYGDKVAFYLVAGPCGYLGDSYVDEFEFLGGNPLEDPLRGLACRQGDLTRDIEQRARKAKQVRMEHVTDSIPILVDEQDGNMFQSIVHLTTLRVRNSAEIGGGGWFSAGLFDQDGRLVMGTGAVKIALGAPAEGTKDYYIGIAHDPARNLEREIRALLSRGGKGPSSAVPDTGIDRQRNFLTVAEFKIVSIDAVAGKVTAEHKGKKYHFKMAADSRVGLEKWAGPDRPCHFLGTLTDIKPGMTVYPDIVLDRPLPELRPSSQRPKGEPVPPFPVEDYAGREIRTLRLNTYSMYFSKIAPIESFNAFFGRVTKRDQKSITVECSKAELEKADGWRRWQAMGGKASVETHPSKAIVTKERLAIMKKMLAEPGDTVKRVFAIDRAVRINRNGILQDMNLRGEAVQVGDFVCVQYEYFYELQDEKTRWPEWIWAAGSLRRADISLGRDDQQHP